MSEEYITQWLEPLKDGDHEAAEILWNRCYDKLVGLAQKKMRGMSTRVADEEDVAVSVFKSLCHGAQRGMFSNLDNRDDLWRILVHMTTHKVIDRARHDRRLKRGGGEVRGESAFQFDNDGGDFGIEQVVGREPTPEFIQILAEEHQRMLASLGDASLEGIATGKLDGKSNEELAADFGCSVRTIERKLRLIRNEWSEYVPCEDVA